MSELTGKRVFVTGGTGFVGSWLAKALIDEGAKIILLVRNTLIKKGSPIYLERDKVKIIRGDLNDYDSILKILMEEKIEICFHLAALLQSKNSLDIFNTNIKGTWNILEACKNAMVRKVIVGSTFKTYGNQKPPFKEISNLKGKDSYSISKSCSDFLTLSYNHENMTTSVIRCANIYGGYDLDFNGIVQSTIKELLDGKIPQINGNCKSERDFIYVKDMARAYILLAKNLHKKEVQGQIFNFGSGKIISIDYLYNKIIGLLGKDIKPIILDNSKEIDKRYMEIEKAKIILDWENKYSLEQGLKETIEWYKNFENESSFNLS